jgi:hypothetical protein
VSLLRRYIVEAMSASSSLARDVACCEHRSGLRRLAYAVAGPSWHDLAGRQHRVPYPSTGDIRPWWPDSAEKRRRAVRLLALVPRALEHARRLEVQS